MNENKFLQASPVSVPASPVSVKLYTYDGKTSWEVYKVQFCIISEDIGWTEEIKACQLVASLRGEPAEVLQTLPDNTKAHHLSFLRILSKCARNDFC
ncbi:UNVERIFIED_CONTAM: hypothetical protein NCL1_28270 [Trichonephila clavipes]